MSRQQPSDSPSPAGGDACRPEVAAALEALGWLLPQSEAQVAAAEDELRAQPVTLPEALRDPQATWERPTAQTGQSEATFRLPESSQTDATLARAARQGGAIPPETEAAMRRDREAAERESERDGKDE
jgi:hypothetical protein